MQSLSEGDVITEKLRYPGIETVFEVERSGDADVTEVKARLPFQKPQIPNTLRSELAEAISFCCDYQKGQVVGLNWSVGDDFVTVKVDKNAKVTRSERFSEEDVSEIILSVLKSRAVLRAFEWDFEKPFIAVHYDNVQFVG